MIFDADADYKPKTDEEKKIAAGLGEALFVGLRRYPGAAFGMLMVDLEGNPFVLTASKPASEHGVSFSASDYERWSWRQKLARILLGLTKEGKYD